MERARGEKVDRINYTQRWGKICQLNVPMLSSIVANYTKKAITTPDADSQQVKRLLSDKSYSLQ